MKSSRKTVFLSLGAISLAITLITSCVKVPTAGIEMPTLLAKARLINAAADIGDPGIKMDGAGVGALAPENMIAYKETSAGRHVFQAGTEKADSLQLDTDFLGTVYVVTKTATQTTRFIKLLEHRRYKPAALDTMMHLIVSQLSPDATPKIELIKTKGSVNTTEAISAAMAYTSSISRQLPVKGWTYAVRVLDGTTELAKVSFTPVGGKGKTVLVMNPKASLKAKTFDNE